MVFVLWLVKAAGDCVFMEKAKVFASPFAVCLEFSQSQMAKLSSSEVSSVTFSGFSTDFIMLSVSPD